MRGRVLCGRAAWAALSLLLVNVGVARADESALRGRITAPGAAVVRKQKPCEVGGRGRSWANLTSLSVSADNSESSTNGFLLYLQDTKVDRSGDLLTGNKTDGTGIYTSVAYIDARDADSLLRYLDSTIATYRDIQGRDMGQIAYTFTGVEDYTIEMAVDGKHQEFSIYSSGKLLRGESFAVVNRPMKVTLKGVEELEKLRDYIRASQSWFTKPQ